MTAEIMGKTKGRAKKSAYNFLSTWSSANLLDKIAGAKFKSVMSITERIRHLRIIYMKITDLLCWSSRRRINDVLKSFSKRKNPINQKYVKIKCLPY